MAENKGFKVASIKTIGAIESIFLVVNPLIWYYAIVSFLQNMITQMSLTGFLSSFELFQIWGFHFSGIIVAAFAGSLLVKRFNRRKFLTAWMALGAISPLVLLATSASSIFIIDLSVLFLGVSLGIGMPTCMGYFTESVPINIRGRMGGIIMLLTGVGIFAFALFPTITPMALSTVLVGWRLSGVLVFHYSKRNARFAVKEHDTSSYKRILGEHSLLLYLIPWLMFSLINYLAGPVQDAIVGEQIATTTSILRNVIIGVFAVIGGFLLDTIGRKRVAILGFVMLGVDSAALGLFPQSVLSNYFSAIVDGVAWGFLLVIFIVTVWGDLSQGNSSSKYYAIGVSPFFVSKLLQLTVGEGLSNFILLNAGTNGLFSFLAFFLFTAVLPLVYAPETLPEKVMKDRDLKNYLEKAMKKVQTETEKMQDIEPEKSDEEEDDSIEFEFKLEENEDEYEEAQKLAEKLY